MRSRHYEVETLGTAVYPPPGEPERREPINWGEVFGNAHPVEVEVGFGKGQFLVTSAELRPGVNFFGLEVERKLQLMAADRVVRGNLANVRVALADAGHWFRHLIPAESVAVVHVYFPDPWWKRRHRKRRVFSPEFAADAWKVLLPGGRLSIATDVEEYFGVMRRTVAGIPAFVEEPAAATTVPGLDVETNFERKARLAGTAVHRALYRKA